MRIIFMGTPEFAVASLATLVENNCNVVAVVTSPDKPSGRGLTLHPSPVKQYAIEKGIPVLQPEKLKKIEFLEELRSYEADLQIVVAFRMLPEVVWAMPPMGTFNLHASLLPQYRGAAPINWAIIDGQRESGVTTFFIQHEIDTGNIIFQEKEPILPEDNVGTYYEKLMNRGAKLVLKTVQAIENKNYVETPQNLAKDLKHAPKIFKETCEINWNRPTEAIHNFVRGLSPYPAAWTTLSGKILKIYRTGLITTPATPQPASSYISDGKKYLYFACSDGYLAIEELQIEGKKRMSTEEFLRGYRL